MRLDELRISLGPCRAPGLLVTPRSVGTPIKPMSTSASVRASGARMKVAISVYRGSFIGSYGSDPATSDFIGCFVVIRPFPLAS